MYCLDKPPRWGTVPQQVLDGRRSQQHAREPAKESQLMPRTRRERFLALSLSPSLSLARLSLSLSLSTRRAACAGTGDVVVFGIGRAMFQSALVACADNKSLSHGAATPHLYSIIIM